jgi:hypothetical protein
MRFEPYMVDRLLLKTMSIAEGAVISFAKALWPRKSGAFLFANALWTTRSTLEGHHPEEKLRSRSQRDHFA